MVETSHLHEMPQVPEPTKPILDIASSSIASEYHTGHNEDRVFFDSSSNSFGVFDGMGGEINGEEAAMICLDVIGQSLKSAPEKSTRNNAKFILEKAYNQANQELIKKSNFDKNEIVGSTATYGFVYKNELGNYEVAVANSGDSRAYLFRDGVLTKITKDHSLTRYYSTSDSSLVEEVLDTATQESSLTQQQLAFFKKRNVITNHVGHPDGSVEIYYQTLRPGDIILLSSDGVHDNLTTQEISSIITDNKDYDSSLITQKIIEKSISRSKDKSLRSKKDDMTALVVKVSANQNSTSESNQTKKSNYLPKQGDSVNVERSSGLSNQVGRFFMLMKKKVIS